MHSNPWVVLVRIVLLSLVYMLAGCTRHLEKGETYNDICDIVPADEDAQNKKYEHTDRKSSGDAFRDLLVARAYLHNKRASYAAFECDKERVNDANYDRPLIVSAIAAGAAALAKSNPYVIGGIGLTAGGIAAFKTHDHPDTDRDAFLTAYEKFTCAYDATHSLRDSLRLETLKADRDALRAALDAVNADEALVLDGRSPSNPAEKAASTAASAAKDAGATALDAVNKEIQNYGAIASAIYTFGSSAEIAARKASRRNGSYTDAAAALKATYTAVSETTLDKAGAKAKVSEAATADAVAKSLAEATPKDNKLSATQKSALVRLVKRSGPLTFAASADDSAALLKDSGGTVKIEYDETSTGIQTLRRKDLPAGLALADTSTSQITRLVRIAEITTNDLPSPSYTQIIANIATCSAL